MNTSMLVRMRASYLRLRRQAFTFRLRINRQAKWVGARVSYLRPHQQVWWHWSTAGTEHYIVVGPTWGATPKDSLTL